MADARFLENIKSLRVIIDAIQETILVLSPDGEIQILNEFQAKIMGMAHDEIIGKNVNLLFPHSVAKSAMEIMAEVVSTRKPYRSKEIIFNEEYGRYFCQNCYPVHNSEGKVEYVVFIVQNITDLKLAEEALRENKRELEKRNVRLEELNIALGILLEKRDEDIRSVEEKVSSNIKRFVLPYLEKLNNKELNDNDQVFIEIMKSNLEDIISSFNKKWPSNYSELTNTEIQVADLIKQGLSTKEIAERLNSSPGTVSLHRKNIRKKLNLTGKKTNLGAYLLTAE